MEVFAEILMPQREWELSLLLLAGKRGSVNTDSTALQREGPGAEETALAHVQTYAVMHLAIVLTALCWLLEVTLKYQPMFLVTWTRGLAWLAVRNLQWEVSTPQMAWEVSAKQGGSSQDMSDGLQAQRSHEKDKLVTTFMLHLSLHTAGVLLSHSQDLWSCCNQCSWSQLEFHRTSMWPHYVTKANRDLTIDLQSEQGETLKKHHQ